MDRKWEKNIGWAVFHGDKLSKASGFSSRGKQTGTGNSFTTIYSGEKKMEVLIGWK